MVVIIKKKLTLYLNCAPSLIARITSSSRTRAALACREINHGRRTGMDVTRSAAFLPFFLFLFFTFLPPVNHLVQGTNKHTHTFRPVIDRVAFCSNYITHVLRYPTYRVSRLPYPVPPVRTTRRAAAVRPYRCSTTAAK